MSDTQRHRQQQGKGKDSEPPKDQDPPEYVDDKKDTKASNDKSQKPVEMNDAKKSTKKGATQSQDETKETREAAEDGVDVTEEPEQLSKDGDNPLEELKKGLSEGKKDSPGGEQLKEIEPEPLTEEEKKKLTPGGNVPDASDAAEDSKEKTEDTTKDAEGKTDDDAAGKTEDLAKDAEGKTEGQTEGLAKDAEGRTKDLPEEAEGQTEDATEKAEDAVDKTEDTTKDVEATADETAKEGEDVTGETAKEGEDATDAAAKEGEVDTEGGTKGLEDTADEASKEGEGVEKSAEDTAEDVTKEGEEAAEEAPVDLSVLKGGKVNKGGNVINEEGKVVGRIKEGVLANLVGKRVDESGLIWNDSGKQIGKAELIPEDERDAMGKEAAPFESFPDATVDSEGYVVFNEERVGKVSEGDLKRLRGMKVDADGDILDRNGNVVGKAERWEAEAEPEPEPEQEVDRSILAGKRVNKAGNVVDAQGNIFGRVVEGEPKSMIGRMCDKKGNILSESGDVIGRADVVPEGEREGLKEGPFAELSGCTVTKDGKVITPGGDVVGRLVKGDGKVLFGRAVDEDGDICDKNGNVLGKAERWEEPEVEKRKGPMAGRRVNREGNVVDEDGNLIGKLTTGELSICAGKEIDDDGDVNDSKGRTIGHVSLVEDIPKDEESADHKQKREQAEQDKKLAQQMSYCLTQCLDKVKPICSMITQVREVDATAEAGDSADNPIEDRKGRAHPEGGARRRGAGQGSTAADRRGRQDSAGGQRYHPRPGPRRPHPSKRQAQDGHARCHTRGASPRRYSQGTDRDRNYLHRQRQEEDRGHATREEGAEPSLGAAERTPIPNPGGRRAAAQRRPGLGWTAPERPRPRWHRRQPSRWPGCQEHPRSLGSRLSHRFPDREESEGW